MYGGMTKCLEMEGTCPSTVGLMLFVCLGEEVFCYELVLGLIFLVSIMLDVK